MIAVYTETVEGLDNGSLHADLAGCIDELAEGFVHDTEDVLAVVYYAATIHAHLTA